jgi:hypothetical protein
MPVETVPCSIDALAAKSACFNCLSQSEKMAAIVFLLGSVAAELDQSMEVTDPAEARKLIACFTCEPESVLDSFLVAVIMDLAVDIGAIEERMTVAELRKEIRCLGCGIGPKEFKAAQVFLWCKLFNAMRD